MKLKALKDDSVFKFERGVIAHQLASLTRLVDDMLDGARAARDGTKILHQRLAIRAVLADAAEIAAPMMQIRNHTVSVTLPAADIFCDGDAGRLVQVFSNLLTNAARYPPDGGRIDICATVDGPECSVAISDTGQGIAALILPHLFDLYYQGAQTPGHARVGFGIGLSLVKDLVGRHGGTVAAFSRGVGCGSTFIVRLPLARAARPPVIDASLALKNALASQTADRDSDRPPR